MISSQNVYNDKISFDDVRYLQEEDFNNEDKRTSVRKGDVLLTIVGTVGRCAVFSFDRRITLQRSVAVLRPQNCLKPRFLMHCFISKSVWLNEEAHGIAQKGLYLKQLAKVSIPVPPIAEQEKIVAELDCLTGIIEKKKQQLNELDKLAQSIFYDMFGDPITNEKGWEVKKLGEMCSAITKGTTPTTLGFNFSNTGINFIKIESIAEDGSFVREKFAHIPEECDKLMARSQLQNGDILFSIAGALGRCAIVNETILPGNTNQALAILRLLDKGEEMLKYVEYYLRSQYVRRVIETLKTGVAQLNLSLGQLKQMLIVLPPVLYLRDFYVKAKAIEKQKELVKQSIVETETLFNSRMDFWFNN